MQGAPRKSTRGRYGPPFLPPLSLSLSSPQFCRVARKRVAEDGNNRAPARAMRTIFATFPSVEFIRHALYFVSSTRLAEFNLSCPRCRLPGEEHLLLRRPDRDYFSPRIREYLNSIRWGLMNCLNAIIFVYTIWLQKE